MKKIGLLIREKIVVELKEKVKEAEGCFFIGFSKIAAFPLNTLRNNLKDSKAGIFVAKNSLFKRALLEDLKQQQDLSGFLEAETGVVFAYDKDVVKTCKILVDFAKENEALQLKGGIIDNKKITLGELNALAKLPSKDILLGMAVSAIASPLTGVLSVFNQIILKFIWVIKEVNKQKERI